MCNFLTETVEDSLRATENYGDPTLLEPQSERDALPDTQICAPGPCQVEWTPMVRDMDIEISKRGEQMDEVRNDL